MLCWAVTKCPLYRCFRYMGHSPRTTVDERWRVNRTDRTKSGVTIYLYIGVFVTCHRCDLVQNRIQFESEPQRPELISELTSGLAISIYPWDIRSWVNRTDRPNSGVTIYLYIGVFVTWHMCDLVQNRIQFEIEPQRHELISELAHVASILI